jgi:thiol-disulfide isomerase/thioredoxin
MRTAGRREWAAAFSRIGLRAGILPLAALAALTGPGCGPRGGPPPAAAPRLDVVDHAELMRRVAAHRGKVVVLDCWSTSCPPCVREFPGLVRLAADHPGTVACMSLSFDYEGLGTVADAATRVREFLAAVHAGQVENLLGSEEADVMYRRLELDSVPAVYVWRPDGTLARRFDDDDARRRLGRAFTYADVAAEVRSLVAE